MTPSQPKTVFEVQPVSDYGHDVSEFIKNNKEEAVLRELFSNAVDAGATKIELMPLFAAPNAGHQEEAGGDCGLLFMDNGSGMLLQSADEKSNVPLKEPKTKKNGKNCGHWKAFYCSGMSSKDKKSTIGHKGQGSKLLFGCTVKLFVVSKTEDDDAWCVLLVEEPLKYIRVHKNMRLHRCTSEEVEDLFDPDVNDEEAIGIQSLQMESHREDYAKRLLHEFLQRESGTLVMMIGLPGDFGASVMALDKYQWDLKREKTTDNLKKVNDNDYIKLAAFIKYKTIVGYPLCEERLKTGDFENHWIRTLGGVVKKQCDLPEVTMHVRGKEENQIQARSFSPGLEYMEVKHTTNAKADPERVKDGNDALFQDRHIKKIKVGTEEYIVILAVDGIKLRLAHYSDLNRKGGKREAQKRTGYQITEFCGVVLYCKGMYVCKFAELLTCPALDEYKELVSSKALGTAERHFLLIIDGPFTVQSSRDGIAVESKNKLRSSDFTDELKRALDSFKNDDGNNNFNKLLRRINGDAIKAISEEDDKYWSSRKLRVEKQARMQVTIPAVVTSKRTWPRQILHRLQPDYHENAVIYLYGELSQAIPDEYFEQDEKLKTLKWFWPRILEASGGEGIDAIGFLREDQETIISVFDEDMFPLKYSINLEFKKANYGMGAQFNHRYTQTHFIIAWEFDRLYPQSLPLNPSAEDKKKGTKVADKVGDFGYITDTVKYNGRVMKIPESLRGTCFFIRDLKKSDGSTASRAAVDDEAHINFVTVVSLKHLLQATLNDSKLRDNGINIGKISWSEDEPMLYNNEAGDNDEADGEEGPSEPSFDLSQEIAMICAQKLKEIRKYAKDKGIPGCSNKNKNEVLSLVINYLTTQRKPIKRPPTQHDSTQKRRK
jgi:hypothetical protein